MVVGVVDGEVVVEGEVVGRREGKVVGWWDRVGGLLGEDV